LNDLPDHLKFGYAHMIEAREIERELRATGLSGADLYFATSRQYEARHKNDPSYRERVQKWLATSSTPKPVDLIRRALEQIRDGHNDPRTLARDVLAAIDNEE
jgi:hypothetical protein